MIEVWQIWQSKSNVETISPQFYLPPEAAYNCVAQLGELGLYFKDADADADGLENLIELILKKHLKSHWMIKDRAGHNESYNVNLGMDHHSEHKLSSKSQKI